MHTATEAGKVEGKRLRSARLHRAHLLATQGVRLARIAERCGITIDLAKQFLNEKILVKTRSDPSELPTGVRLVKGGAYQARPWVGPGSAMNVNLGLFHPADYRDQGEHRGIAEEQAIAAAAFAAREFIKRIAWQPQPDFWKVIQCMQSERRRGLPVVPRHLLPPLVQRVIAPPPDHRKPTDPELRVRGYRIYPRTKDAPLTIFATIEEAWAVAKPIWDAKRHYIRPKPRSVGQPQR